MIDVKSAMLASSQDLGVIDVKRAMLAELVSNLDCVTLEVGISAIFKRFRRY